MAELPIHPALRDDQRVLVGMRVYFGDKTLLQNDRSGATLDIIEPLSLNTPQVN